jgi:hypothetical protein
MNGGASGNLDRDSGSSRGRGILWLCFAIGVYFLTRTGREGMRIQRMEDERRQRLSSEQ